MSNKQEATKGITASNKQGIARGAIGRGVEASSKKHSARNIKQ